MTAAISRLMRRPASMARTATLLAVTFLAVLTATAQEPDKRHVTPVKPETNQVKPPPKGTDEKVIQQYLTGDSAAAVAEARKDSLRRAYKRYPLITDLSVGINVAEPLFMAFGQSYASADINATLNMWNRLQPTIELGLGWAKSTPDDLYFTYRGKPSPYFKVGANYNFLFKSSPDYQAIVGIRLGYSTFDYDVTDVDYSNGYWQEGRGGSGPQGAHSRTAGVGMDDTLPRHLQLQQERALQALVHPRLRSAQEFVGILPQHQLHPAPAPHIGFGQDRHRHGSSQPLALHPSVADGQENVQYQQAHGPHAQDPTGSKAGLVQAFPPTDGSGRQTSPRPVPVTSRRTPTLLWVPPSRPCDSLYTNRFFSDFSKKFCQFKKSS